MFAQQISRRALIGGAAAVGAALLAGCGKEEQGPSRGSSGEGVLNVWGALTLDRGVGALLDAFKKEHPGIQVNYTQFTNNSDGNLKLDTSLQGGAPVDVFFSYGPQSVSRRTAAGYARDLTDLAGSDEVAKQFTATDPQLTALFDGRLFAIPTVYNPYLVYLNQDMLDAAGITVPEDWTVQEFHDIAEELCGGAYAEFATYKTLAIATMGLGGDAQVTPDGTSSNFDHELWRRQYELELAMERDGTLFPITRVLAEKVDLYAQSYFLSGDHAFYLDNPATLRFVKDQENYPHDFRTTFRPMPYLERGREQWNQGGYEDSVQISAKTKYPEAAWTFVRYWLGAGAEQLLTAGKISPAGMPAPGAGADALLPGLLGDARDDLFDVEAFTRVAFAEDMKLSVTTHTAGLSEIGTIRKSLDEQLRLGEISVDELLTQLKEQADAAIAKDLETNA